MALRFKTNLKEHQHLGWEKWASEMAQRVSSPRTNMMERLCNTCRSGAFWGQKRAADSLGLGLQMLWAVTRVLGIESRSSRRSAGVLSYPPVQQTRSSDISGQQCNEAQGWKGWGSVACTHENLRRAPQMTLESWMWSHVCNSRNRRGQEDPVTS